MITFRKRKRQQFHAMHCDAADIVDPVIPKHRREP